jgi:hypothetical protein
LSDVIKILETNKQVPFVDRMINMDQYPSRPNYDQSGNVESHSTHLLARGGGGGNEKPFVYPVLQLIDGKWVENEDPTSAIKRGNVIYFDNEKEADSFAQGSWKKVVLPETVDKTLMENMRQK